MLAVGAKARPLVVAIEMGYGHLRPATALASALGTEVLEVDRPPLADDEEQRRWARTRAFYELVSRASQVPLAGFPLRALLDGITYIPHLHPRRDLSTPSWGSRTMRWQAESGLGRGMVARLRESGEALVTTFYAPALIADHHGLERVYCVVTDSDVNRVWAPFDGKRSTIQFFAPSARAERRLVAYGVSPDRIEVTGYPLPPELLGGEDLALARRNLAARLARLDPRRRFVGSCRAEIEGQLEMPLPAPDAAPLITFAVGGAGAQAGIVELFLPSIAELVRAGRLRVALVAGIRAEVAARFRRAAERAALGGHAGLTILHEPDLASYFRSFHGLLARTDVLWSKPSEITFFAALGLPLVFSPPVGVHERYNRRWCVEAGAGLRQRDPTHAAGWLEEWLADGTLAAAAWSGFTRLPKRGVYRIARHFAA
jgi:hypothetical protein